MSLCYQKPESDNSEYPVLYSVYLTYRRLLDEW